MVKGRLNNIQNRLNRIIDISNAIWIVETDFEDHWQPFKIIAETGKKIEAKEIMTSEEFSNFRDKLKIKVLPMTIEK